MNFNDKSICKDVLKQDKHTRLEGLCIEHFFINNYLNSIEKDKISTGWWFSKRKYNDEKYFIIKFQHDLNFREVDLSILNYFKKKGLEIYILFYDDKFKFYTCNIKKIEQINEKIILDSAIEYKYTKLKPLPSSVKDIKRQEQSIDYLEKNGLLKKASIERFFANRIAGFKGLWDIDAICYNSSDELIVYEVKQKFPAKNGNFGINVGTTNFLLFLTDQEIIVEHIILRKPVDDKSIPALDFLQKQEYKGKNEWLSAHFTKKIIENFKTKLSPKETSIHGRYRLKYMDLNMSEFESKGFV